MKLFYIFIEIYYDRNIEEGQQVKYRNKSISPGIIVVIEKNYKYIDTNNDRNGAVRQEVKQAVLYSIRCVRNISERT